MNDVEPPALEADTRGTIVERGDAPTREDGSAEREPDEDLAKRDAVGKLSHIILCVSKKSPCLKITKKLITRPIFKIVFFLTTGEELKYFQDIVYRLTGLKTRLVSEWDVLGNGNKLHQHMNKVIGISHSVDIARCLYPPPPPVSHPSCSQFSSVGIASQNGCPLSQDQSEVR